jgi:L,D-transpeptidase catalytic domain/Putative peptidoglycan binding domain
MGLGGIFADDDADGDPPAAGETAQRVPQAEDMTTTGLHPLGDPSARRPEVGDSSPAPDVPTQAPENAPRPPDGAPAERDPVWTGPEPAPVAPEEPSSTGEPRTGTGGAHTGVEEVLQVADAPAEDAPVNLEAGTEMPESQHPSAEALPADASGAPPPPPTDTGDAGDPPPRGRKNKILIAVGVLLTLLVVGAAGIAYAGYDYSKKYEGRILPGAVVAGVDVGGMRPEEALAKVKEAVAPKLHRTIEVKYGKRSWTVTPKELGAKSNARSAVNQALDASEDMSFVDKTRMRVFGDQLIFDEGVAISYPSRGAHALIEQLASKLDREPQDAELDYSTGWVKIVPEREGRHIRLKRSLHRLKRALLGEQEPVELAVRSEKPKVTSDAYDEVLLLHIGENKLYFYENGKITHNYTVATGMPQYPTPTGVYEVVEKRYMPTWVNPAPDGWGASMPAMIPPGPSNPLGLRAINWSASGIRFHGTTATYSLGHNASHGCVRLSNDDVIQLYDLVEVGTPIVSVQFGGLDPLYTSSSTDTPTAENSAQ